MQEIETPLVVSSQVCPHCHLLHIHSDCGYRKNVNRDSDSKVEHPSLNNTGNIFAGFESEAPVNRILGCKKSMVVVKCVGCNVWIAVPQRCKSRFCVDCARYLSRRAKKILVAVIKERGLNERGKRNRLKLNTLTCRNFPADKLEWGFDAMNRWFANLLRRVITSKVIEKAISRVNSNPKLLDRMRFQYEDWEGRFWKCKGRKVKDFFYGGLKRFESTKGEDGNFHLHIHNFFEGYFLPQPILSVLWSGIVSKGKWEAEVMDIRAIKGLGNAVKEICKYAFKPDGLSLEDKIFLDTTFKNRRLYSFYGEWFKLLSPVDINSLIGDESDFECPCCGGRYFHYEYAILESEMSGGWKYGNGVFVLEDSS